MSGYYRERQCFYLANSAFSTDADLESIVLELWSLSKQTAKVLNLPPIALTAKAQLATNGQE